MNMITVSNFIYWFPCTSTVDSWFTYNELLTIVLLFLLINGKVLSLLSIIVSFILSSNSLTGNALEVIKVLFVDWPTFGLLREVRISDFVLISDLINEGSWFWSIYSYPPVPYASTFPFISEVRYPMILP